MVTIGATRGAETGAGGVERAKMEERRRPPRVQAVIGLGGVALLLGACLYIYWRYVWR